MKEKKFFMIILALSAMVMSMSSCSYVAPYMDSPYYGAEEIEGPWSNNGYTIREIGWGEYEVIDIRSNTYWIEYLDPFHYYEYCLPEGCWAEYYEPYYSTSKDELCWHVYCRGQFKEVLIFQSGKYAPM